MGASGQVHVLQVARRQWRGEMAYHGLIRRWRAYVTEAAPRTAHVADGCGLIGAVLSRVSAVDLQVNPAARTRFPRALTYSGPGREALFEPHAARAVSGPSKQRPPSDTTVADYITTRPNPHGVAVP